MADTVDITAGTGTTIATDDVAGVHYQRVKLTDGTADSSAVIAGDATNGLDVDVTRIPTVTGTGSFTALDEAVTLTLAGAANAAWQVTGTFSATVTFEATTNGSNWVAIWAYQAGSDAIVQGTTTTGIFRNSTAGFASVRARCSAYASGTVEVTGVASHGTSGVFVNFPLYGAQQLGKQEDVASLTADTGVGVMAVQKATPANTAGTDGDYEFLQMSAGRVWASSIVTGTVPLPTGASTAALQLPDGHAVTVDNAAGAAAVNIQDGGNAITVDGTVAVSSITTAIVPGTGATNLGKAEDDPHATGDVGIQVLAVRDDTLNIRSGAENDYEPLHTDANGALWIKSAANNGTDIGDITINNAAGAAAVNIQDGGNAITVDGTVAVSSITTSITPGTAAANLGKAEDSAHASLDVGVMALAVSNEANTARAADGDYLPIATDTEGNVRNVGNRDHDAIDAGEPVKIGAKAIALKADPTAVASNDRTDLYAMRNGIQFTLGGHPNLITKQFNITDADGAQTDLNILNAVVAATDIAVVTHIAVTCDNANTVDVAVRIGFGAANTPAADAAGIILSHPGIAPGSGMIVGNGAGILGIGAVGEELRMTSEDPTTGNLDVVVGYFIISNA
jgi:hypothetical protein